MRKDVKLGMAIGGGLISVLVGYLLFAPPANTNKKGGSLATNTNGGGAPLGSIIDPPAPGELSGEEKPATGAPKPGAADGGSGNVADTGGGTGAKPADPSAGGKPGDKKSDGSDWTVLDKGAKAKGGTGSAAKNTAGEGARANRAAERRETGLTQAHATPASRAETAKLFYNPNDAFGGGVSDGALFDDHRGSAKAGKNTGPTAIAERLAPDAPVAGEPVAEPGTHIVRSGETLSGIARQAYGNQSLYTKILEANPGLKANNLKLGAVIKLPKVEDVRSPAATADAPTGDAINGAPSVREEPKIDSARQYRVVQGDSLYQISKKVYGKSTYVEKLYERNKVAIGPNPTRLKLGMVLELPEKAPTAAATPAGDPTTSSLVGPAEDGQGK